MIKRAYSLEDLSLLPESGVEAQKIRALLIAYGTKYDFCRFYVSESVILCETDGSFVLCEYTDDRDVNELAEFFTFHGFLEIFCSKKLGELLLRSLHCSFQKINLMRFYGKAVPNEDIENSPPLDDVYKILKTTFNIEYEPWYADMSHRIRHGVSGARVLGGSALIIQHNLNGEALLSQIATLPEQRRLGGASRLIKAVCAELYASDVYVLCEDKLLPFYGGLGFEKVSEKMVLAHSDR